MRMMSYDRSANERNAVSALSFARSNNIPDIAAISSSSSSPLGFKWHRLDDGVMGGQSQTNVQEVQQDNDNNVNNDNNNDKVLRFTGIINTNGGGFASLRAPIPAGTLSSNTMTGLRLVFRGDGKTYKFLLLSDGSGGGPWAKSPSWQIDIPTTLILPASSGAGAGAGEGVLSESSCSSNVTWQEAILPFDSFLPNMGPGRRRVEQHDQQHQQQEQEHVLDPAEMQQMGIMLSLLKANNEPNPPETFGQGIFPFTLEIQSIQPVLRPVPVEHQEREQQCQDNNNREDKT